jgi:hypothetical protein
MLYIRGGPIWGITLLYWPSWKLMRLIQVYDILVEESGAAWRMAVGNLPVLLVLPAVNRNVRMAKKDQVDTAFVCLCSHWLCRPGCLVVLCCSMGSKPRSGSGFTGSSTNNYTFKLLTMGGWTS